MTASKAFAAVARSRDMSVFVLSRIALSDTVIGQLMHWFAEREPGRMRRDRRGAPTPRTAANRLPEVTGKGLH